MISITIGGETAAEFRSAFAVALQLIGGGEIPQGAPATPAPVDAGKKGPGRPPKGGKTAAEMAAEMGLSPAATTPAAPATAPAVPAFTEEQVRAKLAELMAHRTGDADETTGMVRVQAVLAKVGAQQIKAVPASRYAELVQYIDAA